MAIKAAPILERIVMARRAAVELMKTSASATAREQRLRSAPPPRDFRQAISGSGVAVIAECKQRSPSAGLLQPDYDPVRIARLYAAGGAAAISVLTEPEFFGGSMGHLSAVRAAVDLPVLCKDFIIDPAQVEEARAAGADAILLIVALLDDASLASLHQVAISLGMQALVEVHSESEVTRALAVGPAIIGINNRDLSRMKTEQETTRRLRPLIPESQAVVSESGIQSREDIIALGTIGIAAVLIGEALLRSSDLGEKMAELTGR
ncbi:MAG: indole-3-glycerol phosphate synthase TrpC [Candidatus Dormibacteria bacterium]